MLKKFSVFLLVITAALFLVSSCGGNKSQELSKAEKVNSPSAEVMRISREDFDATAADIISFKRAEVVERVEANGYVRVLPQFQVLVSSLVGGHVKKVYVREGEWVKAGAPLFLLEDPGIVELQQNYLEAHSSILSLQADFERQKMLAKENIASEKSFLKAQSDYMAELARVTGLKSQIKMLGINLDKVESAHFTTSVEIPSPIEGGIASMEVKQGMYLSPERVALEVVNPNEVYLELSVFEKDVSSLKRGGAVRFRVPGNDQKWENGHILFVGQQVRDESRTVSVQVKVDKLSSLVLPGMFVEAEILLPGWMASTLPDDAVAEWNGKQWALLVSDEDPQGFSLKPVEVISRMGGDGSVTILNADEFSEGSRFLNKSVEQFISGD
jgi:cobalt-zinc-cadmium efflux system membrane fusion protein